MLNLSQCRGNVQRACDVAFIRKRHVAGFVEPRAQGFAGDVLLVQCNGTGPVNETVGGEEVARTGPPSTGNGHRKLVRIQKTVAGGAGKKGTKW